METTEKVGPHGGANDIQAMLMSFKITSAARLLVVMG
jgi:hypothetical protein